MFPSRESEGTLLGGGDVSCGLKNEKAFTGLRKAGGILTSKAEDGPLQAGEGPVLNKHIHGYGRRTRLPVRSGQAWDPVVGPPPQPPASLGSCKEDVGVGEGRDRTPR